ncbi:MAG: sulfite exporter TauE/SafE family protein [Bryobacterales bacterium]|nr:sulfite exporter TauE/SafE family protein [Bryobacterales bacterium]
MLATLDPLQFGGLVLAFSFVAGLLGALLGLGGGIIVTPLLTLAFGLDIHIAIGASLLSVIATSSGAAAAYAREGLANLRVSMMLEIGTTSGAMSGALLAGLVHRRFLFLTFGLILGYSALRMLQNHRDKAMSSVPHSAIADRLRLHDRYYDEAERRWISYRVARPGIGLVLMYIAGLVSGFLGIGSGALKVPAMDMTMRLPIKVSTASSNFMMGVTAAASASVYFARGDIHPLVAGPVAAGVLIGATIGSRVLGQTKSRSIRIAFVIVLLIVSVQMLIRGAQL